jgi:hypothetical protein
VVYSAYFEDGRRVEVGRVCHCLTHISGGATHNPIREPVNSLPECRIVILARVKLIEAMEEGVARRWEEALSVHSLLVYRGD